MYDSSENKYLHFVARGISPESKYERYVLDIGRGIVDRFKFNNMNATTIDFSTTYQPLRLQDDLVANYHQYALNCVV